MTNDKIIKLIAIIKAIKNEEVIKAEYQDKYGNVTQKIIEPFAVGVSAKDGRVCAVAYQSDGSTTSNEYDFKTLFLDSFLSIEPTGQHFNPKLREGLNPDHPVSNVNLIPESIFMVDY